MKRYSVLIILFCHTIALAQWEPLDGPTGGYIYSIYHDDTVIYASAHCDLYRSFDDGHHWMNMECDLPTDIFHSTILYAKKNILFLELRRFEHGNFSMLYRSSDYGKTFQLISDSSVGFTIVKHGDVLYLTRSFYRSNSRDRQSLLTSSDDGQTWASIGAADVQFHCIESDGKKLYAITTDTFRGNWRVCKSLDNGISWDTLKGLDATRTPDLLEVTIDQNDTTLWISFQPSIGSSTLYRLDNPSDTLIHQSLPEADTSLPRPYTIWGMQGTGEQLYIGTPSRILVYEVTTNSWKDLTYNLGEFCFSKDIQSFDYVSNQRASFLLLNIDSYGSIVRLDSDRHAYHISDTGITATIVTNLIAYQDTIYATVFGGSQNLYSSGDRGSTWFQTGFQPNQHSDIRALTGTPGGLMLGNRQWIYTRKSKEAWDSVMIQGNVLGFDAIADTIYCRTGNEYFRSTDYGVSWEKRGSPHTTFIAESSTSVSNLLFAGSDFLMVSGDGAMTWTPVEHSFPGTRWRALASEGTHMFAGVWYQNKEYTGLVKSSDQGKSWLLISPQIPSDFLPIKTILRNNSVFFATSKGIFTCDYDGNNWQFSQIGTGKEILDILVDSTHIYVGTNRQGMWKASLEDVLRKSNVKNSYLNLDVPAIFPNPATEEINIEEDSEFTECVIYDLHGRIVRGPTTEKKLDVRHLPAGLYYIKLMDNTRQIFNTTSFIKKN